jgi:hypothetical protein
VNVTVLEAPENLVLDRSEQRATNTSEKFTRARFAQPLDGIVQRKNNHVNITA